jgi:predicted RNA-binding protein YlxR (DUF448 family)
VTAQGALLRYALREGSAVPDPNRRLPGRGAYLCGAADCRERALSRGGFARAFRAPVISIDAK